MRVPIRKAGQFTYIKKDPHITQDKFNELKKELEKLTKLVRPALSKEVQRLAEFGDFSENAAYQIAKGKLRGTNSRIDDLTDRISKAIIIEKHGNNFVNLGNTVIVEQNGKQFVYEILGSTQTNPSKGVISHNSPIGVALLGHSVGDEVNVKLANKVLQYKILKIS